MRSEHMFLVTAHAPSGFLIIFLWANM